MSTNFKRVTVLLATLGLSGTLLATLDSQKDFVAKYPDAKAKLGKCTTCHVAPERHKTAPRTALPSKPETREFCARCHAKDATVVKEAPRIDVSTHGGTFRCWECHYPHHPEGRP